MNRKKSLAAILALSAALMAMCLFAACSETAETESAISVSTPAAGSSTPADSSSDACSVPSMSRTPIPGRAESSSGAADSESVLSRPPESSAMPESRAQPVPSSRPAPAQPSASSSQAPAPVPEPTPQPVPEPPPPAPPPAPSVDVQACIDWGNAYAASLNMGVNGSLAIGAAGFENPIEPGGKTEQQIKDHLTYQLNGIHAMWQSIPEYDPNIVVPCYSIVLSGTQIYVLYG